MGVLVTPEGTDEGIVGIFYTLPDLGYEIHGLIENKDEHGVMESVGQAQGWAMSAGVVIRTVEWAIRCYARITIYGNSLPLWE